MENTQALVGGLFGTILSASGMSMAVSDVQAIISLVITILGGLITITSGIIIPIWKKVRDAKKDGKITPEEVEDIVDTAKDGINDIKNKIDKK